jgi:hypothetical protein
MEKTIWTASNTTAALWEDQMAMFEQLLSCCQDTRRGVRVFASDADLLLKKVDGVRINIAFQDEQRTETLHSHFKQQREFLEKVAASSCPSDKSVVSVSVHVLQTLVLQNNVITLRLFVVTYPV